MKRYYGNFDDEKPKTNWLSRKVMLSNLAIISIFTLIFWFCFPGAANYVIFQGIILNIPWFIPATIGALIAYYLVRPMIEDQRNSLAVVYGLLAVVFFIGGPVLIKTWTNYQIAQMYTFKKIGHIIEVEKKSIRYTPLQVAFKDMNLNSGKYKVDEDYVDPIDINSGFGYVTPIIPDGPLNTFYADNDGYMLFDDNQDTPQDKRVTRIKQSQKIGEGMELLDNIWRNLYAEDMFCKYDKIYYLQLDPKHPDVLTAIAPKIKFKFVFPSFVPYWGGVSLVHADGKIENLTTEEAKKDSRLKGKRITPISLDLKYVAVQIYDQGYIGGWINREGKIKIPDVPGNNKMPYFTEGADGNSYNVVIAEPSGEADAISRFYYTNANTGERLYYEFGGEGVLGPTNALERVKTLRGYKWLEGTNGDHQIIEPVYLTKNGRIYFKFTITTKTFTGITATAVVDLAAKDTVHEFKTRQEFNDWLNEKDTVKSTILAPDSDLKLSPTERVKELKEKLKIIIQELGDLEKSLK